MTSISHDFIARCTEHQFSMNTGNANTYSFKHLTCRHKQPVNIHLHLSNAAKHNFKIQFGMHDVHYQIKSLGPSKLINLYHSYLAGDIKFNRHLLIFSRFFF